MVLTRMAMGDETAVKDCLDTYGSLVWSMARRFTSTTEDAEDAVQDIFVELWRSASRFDPALASETAFVAMVSRRRLIDRVRRTVSRPDTEPLPELEPAGSGASDIERGVEAAKAAEALRTLPGEQRRVLELTVVNGLTHREASEATGLPLGTVKSHVRRGLLAVRTHLLGTPPAEGRTS